MGQNSASAAGNDLVKSGIWSRVLGRLLVEYERVKSGLDVSQSQVIAHAALFTARVYVCMSASLHPEVAQTRRSRLLTPQLAHSCLLPDLARGLLQAIVALLVSAAGAEACANDGRPRPPLEQQH